MLQIGEVMKDILTKDIIKEFSLKCCYPKNTLIYHENDLCDRIGYVVEGNLELIHFTVNGEERLLAELKQGDIFGDFLINSENPYYPGNLVSISDSSICFLEKNKLERLIKTNDDFRHIYLKQLSDKALKLNQHNKLLMQKSLRDKLLMYINNLSLSQNTKLVAISNKQALANYLNVTRQSLFRELKAMKKENIIDFNKKYVWLKEE